MGEHRKTMAKKRAVRKKALPKVLGVEFRAEPITATSEARALLPNVLLGIAALLPIAGIAVLVMWFSKPATAATPNHFPLIAAEIGLATINSPLPNPAPPPPISGKCSNCSGTGKVGDGTVFVPCALCDGKGYTGFSLDLPPFPALETPEPTSVSSPPASLEPAARRSSAVSSSCASGSCGVAGNGVWRPFARLRGR